MSAETVGCALRRSVRKFVTRSGSSFLRAYNSVLGQRVWKWVFRAGAVDDPPRTPSCNSKTLFVSHAFDYSSFDVLFATSNVGAWSNTDGALWNPAPPPSFHIIILATAFRMSVIVDIRKSFRFQWLDVADRYPTAAAQSIWTAELHDLEWWSKWRWVSHLCRSRRDSHNNRASIHDCMVLTILSSQLRFVIVRFLLSNHLR